VPDSKLSLCDEPAVLVSEVARVISTALEDALEARGAASLALPGGTTPALYLGAIAALPLAWEHIHVTLTDERRVSPGDPASNETQLKRLFLHGRARRARYFSWEIPAQSDADAVRLVADRLVGLHWPLDLVVLGMGEDGHVASLFPGVPVTTSDPVVATLAPSAPRARISLSYAALLQARQALVVTTGPAKRALVERVLAGGYADLPIARLQAALGIRLSIVALS